MRRFLAFFCAFVILFACVPAFAVSFDEVFTGDNYGGSIRSNRFAMDALESLQDYLGVYFQLFSPAFLIVNPSGQLYFISPGVARTDPYYIYLLDNLHIRFKDGTEYNSSAADTTSYIYSCSYDLDQYANGVFEINGDWSIQSGYISIFSINNASVWYGNPMNNIYNSSGELVEWPWSHGGSNVQYQIPLSPGNMLVMEDLSGITSIRITAFGLPESPGSSNPYWFTGVRIGNPTTRGQLFLDNGADTYNSNATNAYWEKPPFSTGMDGIATNGIITLTPEDYSNDFLFIYNSLGVTSSSGNAYNPTIYITMDQPPPDNIDIYPAYMVDGYTTFPRQGINNPMYDPNTRPVVSVGFNGEREIYYYDNDRPTISSEIANVPGGYNSVIQSSDPVDSTVGGILGILQSGVRAIQSLVSGSQSFFQTLREMYTWLPTEVYTLLMSCLFLVFVIGVIKVLH